ncbi:MAG: dihydrolipoyl dehydrogenase [Synergistaceae bacterium]|nr:dihydrolipoyl dehydrogenase [Synergistaceae bacterium]
MEKYDLIILGGGPAGYTAADRASEGGMSVALFEGRSLGGTCLNEGCIPTKTMLYSAKLYEGALKSEPYGVKCGVATLDHGAVLKRKDKVVKILTAGVASKMKSRGVVVMSRRARVTGKTGDGYAVTDGVREYVGTRLLIATGSEAVIPPIPGTREGLESGHVITSKEALSAREIPPLLVVVGGGVIGLELACYFHAAGSRVTVVEMLDKIAGPAEADVSKILLGNLKKRGIEFRLGRHVTGIEPGKSVITEEEVIGADKVLLAIGRKPSFDGAGIENIGVRTAGGAIPTDERMRTNAPDVYAAGDVTGRVMLAHAAYREAEVAVNDMLDIPDAMRYDAIPSVIYTNPEVACVGETEESASAKGLSVKVVTLSMRYSGRYMAENEGGDGICKVVASSDDGRLLGVHMINNHAAEIIASAAMMIDLGRPASELRRLIFPHPTAGEIIREALFALE